MFVTGSEFALFETHDDPFHFGDSTAPRNQSRSFGGRTVTRKMRPPSFSRSSVFDVVL